jgi:hypothetical protein
MYLKSLFFKASLLIFSLSAIWACGTEEDVTVITPEKEIKGYSVQIVANENFSWRQGDADCQCKASGLFNSQDQSLRITFSSTFTDKSRDFDCIVTFENITPNNIEGGGQTLGKFEYYKGYRGKVLVNSFPLYESPPSGCAVIDTFIRPVQLGVVKFSKTNRSGEYLFSGNFTGFGYKAFPSECEEPLPRPFSISMDDIVLKEL